MAPTHVRRSDNRLSGTLPAGWAPLGLRDLFLDNNLLSLADGFFATLPSSLETVSLSANPLNSPVPPDLAIPPGADLKMERCNLSGTLPAAPLVQPSTRKPTSMTALSLAENSISGRIPWEAWGPSNASSLNVSFNRLTGSLPAALPPSLSILDLSSNALSGTLPPELLSNTPELLRLLNISHNRFTGMLPQAVGLPSGSFQNIDLSHNNLSGPLPDLWGAPLGRLTDTRLLLNDNQLSGTLSASSSLLQLQFVDLSMNRLTGATGRCTYEPRLARLHFLHEATAVPATCGNRMPPRRRHAADSELVCRKQARYHHSAATAWAWFLRAGEQGALISKTDSAGDCANWIAVTWPPPAAAAARANLSDWTAGPSVSSQGFRWK